MKQTYIQHRPNFLSDLSRLWDEGIREGSRSRLVIFLFANIRNAYDSLILRELPLDIALFSHWKHKYLPAIVRVGIGSEDDKRDFLSSLEYQYFSMSSFHERNAKGEIKSNPYDTFLGASDWEECVEPLLDSLVSLHREERAYVTKHRSEKVGSGGKLVVIGGEFISSVSSWRRCDWLVLAQGERISTCIFFTLLLFSSFCSSILEFG